MSFNEFKNNTQILKKYLIKMNSITECEIKSQWIDENFLKLNNPHIFLQILHYILIKFSPSTLFVKALDFYPTIKDDNDKKFVTNSMNLARKILGIDVKIDIDQFLSPKFVQKKTQFISDFCKEAFQYHLKQTKSTHNLTTNIIRKQNEYSDHIPSKIPVKFIINDDSDDQIPRNLNIAPSTNNKQYLQESSQDQDLKQLINKRKQMAKKKEKTLKVPSQSNSESLQQADNNKKTKFPLQSRKEEANLIKNLYQTQQIQKNVGKNQKKTCSQRMEQPKHQKNIEKKQIHQQIKYEEAQNHNLDLSEYVSRSQFLEIVSGMTKNFTQLLSKFNDFQFQVSGWVQNINAKVSILEENIKTIKNNL